MPNFSPKRRQGNDHGLNKSTTASTPVCGASGGAELFSSKQTSIQSFFASYKKRRGVKRGRVPEKPPSDNSPLRFATPPSSQSTAGSLVTTPPTTPATIKSTKLHTQVEKKRVPLQQMYLDLGQRNFAMQTICQTCGMLFVHGLSEDALQHKKICQDYLQGIPFNAKNARVVERRNGDIIVEIRPSDSYELRQKVKRINAIVDSDLGFAVSNVAGALKTSYLFVRNKRVLGMATVEIISKGFALKSLSERSNESRKAMVGVHKIWVHKKCRKMRVASMLVDAARSKFVYGLVVPVQMVAFSSPTEAGAEFATHYIRSASEDDAAAALVYDCV